MFPTVDLSRSIHVLTGMKRAEDDGMNYADQMDI